MNTYYQMALTVPTERRKLALDLADNLDLLNDVLQHFAEIFGSIPTPFDDPETNKVYFTALRSFLAAQRQFEKLLPPLAAAPQADALTEFNAQSVYDSRGLITL